MTEILTASLVGLLVFLPFGYLAVLKERWERRMEFAIGYVPNHGQWKWRGKR